MSRCRRGTPHRPISHTELRKPGMFVCADGCADPARARRDAQTRSIRSPRWRIRRRPRRPRIRRRLPYTGARASGSFDQSRRPLSGSHVGPDTHGVQVDQGLIAIPLTDDLFQRLPVNVGLRVFDLLGRGDGGLDDRRGVPTSAPCSVTATIAPVSMSTARLCGQMRAPSFIFVTSGIVGVRPVCVRGLLLPLRSSRARPSRVGVSTPEAVARPARNAW